MTIKKYFGTKKFYKEVFILIIPIMLQQLIQTLVQLIDNIMVGRLGDISMSAVTTTNQITFVMMLAGFGLLGGAGIFISQYLGANDFSSIKKIFQFKLLNLLGLYIIGILIIYFFRVPLVTVFIKDSPEAIKIASDYAKIVVWCFIPYAVAQSIEFTFRELYMPKYSMIIASSAIVANTCLNAILIFGLFGFPALGAVGAAIATVIARTLEAIIAIIFMKKYGEAFSLSVSELFTIDKVLYKKIYKKALPLVFNETIWSVAKTLLFFAYTQRGLAAIAGISINMTISNLTYVVLVGTSNAIAIMVAKQLGANQLKEARETANKLIMLSVILGLITALVIAIITPFVLMLYDVSPEALSIARTTTYIYCAFLVAVALTNSGYFILRSGGAMKQTVLIDSIFVMVIQVPTAIILAMYTAMPVTIIFLIVNALEWLKAIITIHYLKTDIWVNNITLIENN